MNAVLTPLLGQPVAEAVGDELAAVVGAQHLRATVPLEETLELGDHVGAAHPQQFPVRPLDEFASHNLYLTPPQKV